ncbi:DUF427 domain-containing protein [Streptacidiphilus sp. PAMC 29251]
MTTREPKPPGPDHPITIAPTGVRVVARVGAHVIADTSSALTLREADYPPVQYIPIGDVDPALLAPSATHTYCPYKGDASYYSVDLPADALVDAVWFYPEPYQAVADIAGHVAFYTDKVDVVVGA